MLGRLLAASAVLIGLTSAAVAQRSPYGPASTVVTSQIGVMNELQKRGPNSYAYGPDAGGRYLVVGPNAYPAPYPYGPRIHRHHRRLR